MLAAAATTVGTAAAAAVGKTDANCDACPLATETTALDTLAESA